MLCISYFSMRYVKCMEQCFLDNALYKNYIIILLYYNLPDLFR